ncbi:MAG TPA: serine/threonine-protein kinase [Mycobacterium sp.]
MRGREILSGRYELRGVLGRGGMAAVHDGWDNRLHRAVAIKLLYSEFNAQTDIRRRFEHEARTAAALSHPNIVAIHDYGEHDGMPFIVMERLPGRTLADEAARGPLHSARVRAVLDDVLSALTAAHGSGVLHRDLKPANILASTAGDAMKIADFGIAKTMGAAPTATGHIVGTMAYLSPERVAGAPASVADDLYAVGVLAYEALTGRQAFPQDSPAALVHAIMDAPPRPLAVSRPDIEPTLAAVIDRAMTRDPRHRFADAEHMRAALGATLGGGLRPPTKVLIQPLAPSATYFAPAPRQRRLSRRTRLVLVAGGALIAIATTALAVALDSAPSAPQPIGTSTPVPPMTATPTPMTTSTPTTSPTPVDEQPPPPKPKKHGHGHHEKRGEG